MAAPIHHVAKTLILVYRHTDQDESYLGIKLFSPVARSDLVYSNSALTITASNGFQTMVQPTNRAHKTDNQLKIVKKTYSVFLSII